MAIYRDRNIAGKKLGEELVKHNYEKPLVLGLPRGGLPVAYEVALALDAPLDTIVARKIALPDSPEFGIGAVAPEGVIILREDDIDRMNITRDELEELVLEQTREMNMRAEYFKSGSYSGGDFKTVIVVDDGLATGVTAEAAVRAAAIRYSPEKLVLAVPVCAPDIMNSILENVDELICLEAPEDFGSVGQWYTLFEQTTSREAKDYLDKRQNDLSNWP